MTISSGFVFGTPKKLNNPPCKVKKPDRAKKTDQRHKKSKAQAMSHSRERWGNPSG